MSSLDWPALKRTTGTPDVATSAVQLGRPAACGYGSTPPEREWYCPAASKNFTTPPSYIKPGMYPRIPIRSTEGSES